MGWDAFASGPGTELNPQTGMLEVGPVREAFEKAAREVKLLSGSFDGFLDMAGLDCSKSGAYLAKATGMNIYSAAPYDKYDVAEIAARADWNFPVPSEETVFYYSAKAFLEACADLGLGISFSW